jgi:hypothetical protein
MKTLINTGGKWEEILVTSGRSFRALGVLGGTAVLNLARETWLSVFCSDGTMLKNAGCAEQAGASLTIQCVLLFILRIWM